MSGSSRRVVVAGWVGSTNLGDELVLAGLRRLLDGVDASATVLSLRPDATRAAHGVEAVGAHDLAAVVRAVRAADLLVLGGGGLLQDETSPLNLPYHLARVGLARARRVPVVGVGLGASGLGTATGRRLVRAALRGVPVAVRDAASADSLVAAGLERPRLAADLAFCLDRPETAPADRLVVCLRPWTGGRAWRPAAWRAPEVPTWLVDGLAGALDGVARTTGLAVRFVALQADRDGAVHERVAARMASPTTAVRPDLGGVLAEVAASRAVVSMRYHGGVAAALAGRPAVLLGYSPKVPALAADLGPGAVALRLDPSDLDRLPAAVGAVLPRLDAVEQAYGRLGRRARVNGDVLAAALDLG